MKAQRTSVLLVSAIFLLSYCKPEGCQYEDSMRLYFKDALNIDLTKIVDTEFYYFVPLESCENCIYETLLAISQLDGQKLTVVLVGNNFHSEWDSLLSVVKFKHKILSDSNKIIYQYESELGKPLLFTIHNGNCHRSRTFSEQQLPELAEELKNL